MTEGRERERSYVPEYSERNDSHVTAALTTQIDCVMDINVEAAPAKEHACACDVDALVAFSSKVCTHLDTTCIHFFRALTRYARTSSITWAD